MPVLPTVNTETSSTGPTQEPLRAQSEAEAGADVWTGTHALNEEEETTPANSVARRRRPHLAWRHQHRVREALK